MPELPEVQTVVSTLGPKVVGRRIESVRLLRSDIVTPPATDLVLSLQGRRIVNLTRRGKRIVFSLDNQDSFYIHLGMTGQLTAEPADRELSKHTHLVLHLGERGRDKGEHRGSRIEDSGRQNRRLPSSPSSILHPLSSSSLTMRFRDPRRFGGVFWLGPGASDADLGPEPLTMTPADLAAALARTARPIKSALLDQRLVAGLGNIYVDESLHAARVHPLTPCRKLKPAQIATLTTEIQRILKIAIAARGSTLRDYVDGNGELGTAQNLHQVYAREGHPCPTCGRPIKRITLSARSTHFCPKCQPRRR